MSAQEQRPDHGRSAEPEALGWAESADAPATAAGYNIGHQQAAGIYQAGRDQYNTNQQHYELKIAPMLDRARRLLRIGIALMLAATALYIWVFVLFGREIVDWNQALFSTAGSVQEPELPEISFAPLAMLPIAFILGFVGFVMTTVALTTRRRARKHESQL